MLPVNEDSAMAVLLTTAEAARTEPAIKDLTFMYIFPVWLVTEISFHVTAILHGACQLFIYLIISNLEWTSSGMH
jgi:hypothetical protein